MVSRVGTGGGGVCVCHAALAVSVTVGLAVWVELGTADGSNAVAWAAVAQVSTMRTKKVLEAMMAATGHTNNRSGQRPACNENGSAAPNC